MPPAAATVETEVWNVSMPGRDAFCEMPRYACTALAAAVWSFVGTPGVGVVAEPVFGVDGGAANAMATNRFVGVPPATVVSVTVWSTPFVLSPFVCV